MQGQSHLSIITAQQQWVVLSCVCADIRFIGRGFLRSNACAASMCLLSRLGRLRATACTPSSVRNLKLTAKELKIMNGGIAIATTTLQYPPSIRSHRHGRFAGLSPSEGAAYGLKRCPTRSPQRSSGGATVESSSQPRDEHATATSCGPMAVRSRDSGVCLQPEFGGFDGRAQAQIPRSSFSATNSVRWSAPRSLSDW